MKLQYLKRRTFDDIAALCATLTPLASSVLAGWAGWAAIIVAATAAATSTFLQRPEVRATHIFAIALFVGTICVSLAFHGPSPDNKGYAQVCSLLTVNVPICYMVIESAVLGALGLALLGLAALTAYACINGPQSVFFSGLISLTLVGMIGASLAFHGLPSKKGYEQICLLLLFGIVVLRCRKVFAGPVFITIALVSVGSVIIGNFSVSSAVDLFKSNKAWTSPLFDHANVLGIAFTALAMFSFLISRSAPTALTKAAGYVFCAASTFLVAASGSRTAILAVGVFFSVFGLGMAFVGNKTVLRAAGSVSLAMVPIITFGYLVAVGAPFHFSPSVTKSAPAISEDVRCERSRCGALQAPQKQTLEPDQRRGGILGLNKRLASGRHIIWPAVIESAGRSPVWGHGLGKSPRNQIPWPKTGSNAHSGFLYMYYQLGLIGVALYIALWVALIVRASNIGDITARSGAVAVLCAACVLETFEIVLVKNHPGTGIAIGILATTSFYRYRLSIPRPSAAGAELM